MTEQKDARVRRPPKKINPARLERVALHYLQRFSTTRANLRNVLMRRVKLAAAHHGDNVDDGAQMVDALILKLAGYGYLDDRAFAEGRSASLHRRGMSERMIRRKLAEKGVGDEDIDHAIRFRIERSDVATERHLDGDFELGAEEGFEPAAPSPRDVEIEAAMNYAKRRRIGPFRAKDRESFRQRDMAALARQGFSYDIVTAVLGRGGDAELEEGGGDW